MDNEAEGQALPSESVNYDAGAAETALAAPAQEAFTRVIGVGIFTLALRLTEDDLCDLSHYQALHVMSPDGSQWALVGMLGTEPCLLFYVRSHVHGVQLLDLIQQAVDNRRRVLDAKKYFKEVEDEKSVAQQQPA